MLCQWECSPEEERERIILNMPMLADRTFNASDFYSDSEFDEVKDKIIKNIPNALTVSRIITSVIAAGAFITGNISLSIGLYTYGAVSDFFDGFLARKLDAFSDVGRKLDALADKLYAGSLLIPSICLGNLLMIIPLILELQISNINLKS